METPRELDKDVLRQKIGTRLLPNDGGKGRQQLDRYMERILDDQQWYLQKTYRGM